jgi:hypothetical protein
MNKDRADFYAGPGTDSRREYLTLIDCLDKRHKSDVFTRMAALFGENFAAFLLTFEGQIITVPTRTYVERMAFYTKVWLYVQDRGSSEETFEDAAVEFNLPPARVMSICEKVLNLLERNIKNNDDDE